MDCFSYESRIKSPAGFNAKVIKDEFYNWLLFLLVIFFRLKIIIEAFLPVFMPVLMFNDFTPSTKWYFETKVSNTSIKIGFCLDRFRFRKKKN